MKTKSQPQQLRLLLEEVAKQEELRNLLKGPLAENLDQSLPTEPVLAAIQEMEEEQPGAEHRLVVALEALHLALWNRGPRWSPCREDLKAMLELFNEGKEDQAASLFSQTIRCAASEEEQPGQ